MGGHNRAKWECLCDCGKKIVVSGTNLRSGNTRSCGCLAQGQRARRYYYQNNGLEAPKGFRWVFLDGNKDNYSADNILFLTKAEWHRAWNRGWLDVLEGEDLAVAVDVCRLESLIKLREQEFHKI